MKFLTLLRANLGRHKRRTILTIASVALALFLFASLRTVVTTLKATSEFGSARRLVSTNATGLVFPNSSLSRPRRASTSCELFASSWPVGSSRRTSVGSATMARAMATRCSWPPESCRG